ncbi:hypothetical protein IWQ47_003644 [Aquimarina sp. EL_43]|nr:hypothetical protein [Aquimarina sp. EL_35]MBG6152515.1 hypothetical protein [Aquimarina sp. EL_32]MBG6170558.1 hypothetical protein [Aquimarina sp. EL_43]
MIVSFIMIEIDEMHLNTDERLIDLGERFLVTACIIRIMLPKNLDNK